MSDRLKIVTAQPHAATWRLRRIISISGRWMLLSLGHIMAEDSLHIIGPRKTTF